MYTPPRLDTDGDSTARRLRAISRVRKLLRLAEDQAGQPEGVSARERAEAILAEHGMSRSAVELGEGLDGDFRQRVFVLGSKEPWRRTLVHAIADYFDCVALYEKDALDAQTFGPEHMLPQVEYTFVVYLTQLRTAWRRHAEDLQAEGLWDRLSPRGRLEARDAFCVSFVLGVKERLEQDRAKEKQDDPVAFSQGQKQKKQLDRWMRTGGVRWRATPSGVSALSDEGFRAGLEAEVEPALKHAAPRRITGGGKGS